MVLPWLWCPVGEATIGPESPPNAEQPGAETVTLRPAAGRPCAARSVSWPPAISTRIECGSGVSRCMSRPTCLSSGSSSGALERSPTTPANSPAHTILCAAYCGGLSPRAYAAASAPSRGPAGLPGGQIAGGATSAERSAPGELARARRHVHAPGAVVRLSTTAAAPREDRISAPLRLSPRARAVRAGAAGTRQRYEHPVDAAPRLMGVTAASSPALVPTRVATRPRLSRRATGSVSPTAASTEPNSRSAIATSPSHCTR